MWLWKIFAHLLSSSNDLMWKPERLCLAADHLRADRSPMFSTFLSLLHSPKHSFHLLSESGPPHCYETLMVLYSCPPPSDQCFIFRGKRQKNTDRKTAICTDTVERSTEGMTSRNHVSIGLFCLS